MKCPCLLLGLLVVGGQTLVADDSTLITLTSNAVFQDSGLPADQRAKPFAWRVPLAKWTQAPIWTPGAGPVPLDAHGAAVAALRWINTQPWADRHEKFREIDLSSHLGPSSPSNKTGVLWYYKLAFNVQGDATNQCPHQVVVLLDGTVVEPTLPASAPAPTHP